MMLLPSTNGMTSTRIKGGIQMLLPIFLLSVVSCYGQQELQQQEGRRLRSRSRNLLGNNEAIMTVRTNNEYSNNNNNLPSDESISSSISGERKPQLAVVHIGPHKTGTTTIQSVARHLLPELYSDGYEVPGDWSGRGSVNMMGLTNCFLPHYNYTFSHNNNNNNNSDNSDNDTMNRQQQRRRRLYDYTCNEQILEDIRQIAIRRSNLFLSAESFSFAVLQMDRVTELLQPWERVKIIVYYRRFFDWLHSQWNQNFKETHPNIRPSFIEWIADIDTLEKNIHNNYVTGCVPRWKEKFNNSNHHEVVLYNMHNMEYGATETFFCNAIPHADHTCTKLREKLSIKGGEQHSNPSHALVYKDLAYAAQELNLVRPDISLAELTESARIHQEHTLQLTQYGFDNIVCPSEEILDKLLQTTLYAEELFFPNFFHERGKDEIHEQFSKERTTKLCHVNAKEFLASNIEWQNYFQSL